MWFVYVCIHALYAEGLLKPPNLLIPMAVPNWSVRRCLQSPELNGKRDSTGIISVAFWNGS